MSQTTSTTTETGAALPGSREGLMSLPGWGRAPTLPTPGPGPDPDPETASARATSAAGDETGDASQSTGQKASIPGFFKGRAKSYGKIAEVLFQAVGGMLNAAVQREFNAPTDAWLPDEEDLGTVPPPLGRIAARRLKIGVDPSQLSDIEDIGMAAVGLLAWAAKGVSAVFAERRARRKVEQGKAVYNETGDSQ